MIDKYPKTQELLKRSFPSCEYHIWKLFSEKIFDIRVSYEYSALSDIAIMDIEVIYEGVAIIQPIVDTNYFFQLPEKQRCSFKSIIATLQEVNDITNESMPK